MSLEGNVPSLDTNRGQRRVSSHSYATLGPLIEAALPVCKLDTANFLALLRLLKDGAPETGGRRHGPAHYPGCRDLI